MKKIALIGLLLLGACVSATEPTTRKISAKASAKDLECRSGYSIAFDHDGNPYCSPDGN